MDKNSKIFLGLLILGGSALAYRNREKLTSVTVPNLDGLNVTVRPERIIESVQPWLLNGMNPQTKELLFSASKRFVNGYFTSDLEE